METSSVHIAVHTGALGASAIHTEHHSTYVSDSHTTGKHSTVTKRELQSTLVQALIPQITSSDVPESEDKAGDKTRSDKEERDAEPKFLISLTHILTSVSQQVQDLNAIIISVCGPIILILLLLVFLTHFCNRRGRKKGQSSAV
ncbi:uncharacterized protein ACMZJ9_018015 [Mantella aurantiaca]